MQITEIALTVAVAIRLFEVLPEKSVWSIPVRQADEHMIAVPASGGFSSLLMQSLSSLLYWIYRYLYRHLECTE